jgi:hypothetical protein
MAKGYLCLVLHAHLPFVRHPEHDDPLEERWLYEAITESYLPMLDVFLGFERDGIDWHLTMSLSPTLCAMLSDSLAGEAIRRAPLAHAGAVGEGTPPHAHDTGVSQARPDVPRAAQARALPFRAGVWAQSPRRV